MIQTAFDIAVVEHLKKHLLIGDGVYQPVRTKQDEVPLLPWYGKRVRLRLNVRTQRTGDQVAAGMAAGLLPGDVTFSTMFSTTE